MGSALLALLDRSIPAAILGDPRLRLRARLVQTVYLLGTIGFVAGFAARWFGTGQLVVSSGVGAIMFAFGFCLLRLTGRFRVSAGCALGLGMLAVVANAVEVGGSVYLLTWGAVLTAGTVFLLGTRAGMAMGASTVAASLLMAYGHHAGWFPPIVETFARPGLMMVAAVTVSIQVVTAVAFSVFHHHESATLIEQLEAARAEAERSTRAKSVFLATMSHEIRTPMNGVLAASDLLRRSPLTPDDHALAELVYGSGAALLGLLDDILDFSKIEAGRVDLESVPFDLPTTASEVMALMTPRARAKGIAAELSIAPGVPSGVRGDAGRLRQVLLNLLGNAVKFTAQGHVRLTVSMDGPGRVRFAIEDTGPGLTAEQQARLFRPFEQADASVRRNHGGTGLGLAISGRLVDAMGGHITIDSAPGAGSTFSFVLPLEEARVPRGRPESGRSHWAAAATHAPILIVDDNLINRRVAQRMVKHFGFASLEAESGERALEIMASTPVSLVLMDREMPGIDGMETTRRIRAMGGARGATPVIGLTGAAFAEDVAGCLRAGMQEVVLKPVTVAAMTRVLSQWIGGAEPVRAPRASVPPPPRPSLPS